MGAGTQLNLQDFLILGLRHYIQTWRHYTNTSRTNTHTHIHTLVTHTHVSLSLSLSHTHTHTHTHTCTGERTIKTETITSETATGTFQKYNTQRKHITTFAIHEDPLVLRQRMIAVDFVHPPKADFAHMLRYGVIAAYKSVFTFIQCFGDPKTLCRSVWASPNT